MSTPKPSVSSVINNRLTSLLRLKFSSFVKALICIFSKVILSSNEGCIMISNKDVQNNTKKNTNWYRAWRRPVLGIHGLSAVLKALRELDQISV